MRIAVSGPQCTGKSTFIQDFLKEWPMYTTPKDTYRDLVKTKKVKINQKGDKESQLAILNYQIDTIQKYGKDDNVIFDRSVIDPLAYSLWMYEKQRGGVDDDHIEYMLKLVKESVKLYDIIFITPLSKHSPVEMKKDGLRDTDETFRDEINNIFTAIQESYYKQSRVIFPVEDCPAVIDIMGSPQERIALAKLYVSTTGAPFGEESSLVQDAIQDGLK